MSTACPAETLSPSAASGERSPAFATTQWSMVLLAGRNDTDRAREALAKLCKTYWYPLYAFARRQGNAPPDAQDLTQAFFARLLERRDLAAADPQRGRFRAFILTAMKHFLASEWQRARTQKRGGGGEVISLDWAAAEQRFDLEPAAGLPPDRAFDRQWAVALLDAVMERLQAEYRGEGEVAKFVLLKSALTGNRTEQPYAELAACLDSTEGAVKVMVHRLRKRYRALLQSEIAETVATPAEAEEEMRYLIQCLSTG
jgi:RNA polymerase sigma-70 factor (ECF subfamily)